MRFVLLKNFVIDPLEIDAITPSPNLTVCCIRMRNGESRYIDQSVDDVIEDIYKLDDVRKKYVLFKTCFGYGYFNVDAINHIEENQKSEEKYSDLYFKSGRYGVVIYHTTDEAFQILKQHGAINETN